MSNNSELNYASGKFQDEYCVTPQSSSEFPINFTASKLIISADIKEVPQYVFEKLDSLVISGCRIPKLPEYNYKFKIQSITLESISTTEEEFRKAIFWIKTHCCCLDYFKISNCGLKTIYKEFSGLNNEGLLDLRDNPIESIEKGTKLHKLEKLVLRNANLRKGFKGFVRKMCIGMPNLKTVVFSHCGLTHIPAYLFDLNLDLLDLTGNGFKTIEDLSSVQFEVKSFELDYRCSDKKTIVKLISYLENISYNPAPQEDI